MGREPSPGPVGTGRRSVVRGPLVTRLLRPSAGPHNPLPVVTGSPRRIDRAIKSAGAVRLRRSRIPPRATTAATPSPSTGPENMPRPSRRRGFDLVPTGFRCGRAPPAGAVRAGRVGSVGRRGGRPGGPQRGRTIRPPGATDGRPTPGAVSAAARSNSLPGGQPIRPDEPHRLRPQRAPVDRHGDPAVGAGPRPRPPSAGSMCPPRRLGPQPQTGTRPRPGPGCPPSPGRAPCRRRSRSAGASWR